MANKLAQIGDNAPAMDIKFSIVTIHLNDFEGLLNTLRSIEPSIHPQGLEWIVVDGGSLCASAEYHDTLAEVIEKSSHYISEPDEGLFDAMNKGSRLASGDYVLFLNAGDELHDEFNAKHLREAALTPLPGMIWGNCLQCYQNGQVVEPKTRSESWTWYGMPASHPSILFRRDLLGDMPYNTNYRLAADYDLVARLVRVGTTVQRIPMCFSRSFFGGVSHVFSSSTLMEEHEVRMRNFSIPRITSNMIRWLKMGLKHLSKFAWLRQIWRSRV